MFARDRWWMPVAVALGVGCGGASEPPPVEPTQGEEAPPPAPFTGPLAGATFEGRHAVLAWTWPGGWSVLVSDHALPEGAVTFPTEATVVAFRLGDRREVPTGEAAPRVELSLPAAADGSARSYSGEVTATALVSNLEVRELDGAAAFPQRVGSAHVRVEATLAPDANGVDGHVAGELDVPVVYLAQPHVSCMLAEPAPTDFTWVDAPTARQVPNVPLHGAVRGHGFAPSTIAFERVHGSDGDSWSLLVTTAPLGSAGVEYETLRIELERAPRRARVTRAMAPGGASWQACEGLGTSTWTADNAYFLDITRWQVGRCTPGAEGAPATLGTASGKLAFVARGATEAENAWVVGTFANVPIITSSCE